MSIEYRRSDSKITSSSSFSGLSSFWGEARMRLVPSQSGHDKGHDLADRFVTPPWIVVVLPPPPLSEASDHAITHEHNIIGFSCLSSIATLRLYRGVIETVGYSLIVSKINSMSSVTQTRSSLPRITAPQLRDLLQRQNSSPTSTPQVTIVDVRDQGLTSSLTLFFNSDSTGN